MPSEPKHAFLTAIERDHGRRLRRYLAVRMRHARPDIADVTQEIYLRLLRIDDHEAVRNPQAYLFTVASHVLHQYALRRSATPEMVEMADLGAELQSVPDADPAVQLEMEQRIEQLARALEQASPRAYATLIMHRCDGIPLQDIASRFGVSYSMVKRYLAKALSYCQKHLQRSE